MTGQLATSSQMQDNGMRSPFPLVDVCGGAFQRGFQFGRACGDMIARYPGVLRRQLKRDIALRSPGSPVPDLTEDELQSRAMRFLPEFERFDPDQVEEMRGIAVGAEVSFSTVLLV